MVTFFGSLTAAALLGSGGEDPEHGTVRTDVGALLVAEGFTAECLCAVPDLRWPSAVHALADGSLLVAEDPMDMPGPPDQPIDRIWRFVVAEDGSWQRTLFAEGLYAVFGLQEIDGAVYVMNMPHLTVLRDMDGDGVAEEREVLIDDLGPPAPGWPGGFNDHIVTGLRLGMDGDLYVSVGDKGVPAAEGTDASRVTLRGGGVVRVHPDGTSLEIVARGTRNHLDVAMNRQDHVFTHDNTDDGLGWWTRVTHILPTGDYGYPWKYHDHLDRMLPPMRDFGGGSPCGGLVYEEAAWPAEYQGNLFFCEWGDGVLRRFVVEPDGAAYRLVSDHDFLRGGSVREFRPVDVCTSPDGRFLYVADWGYGGWRVNDETGRLWRVRCDTERKVPELDLRGIDGRLAGLHHPGFQERILAQRALAAMGAEVVPPLADVLHADPSADARRHAVWALAAIGDAHAFASIAAVLEPDSRTLAAASADTRAQAARALGRYRVPAHEVLVHALADEDPMVVREAAIAAGRLADPIAAGALIDVLRSTPDAFVEFACRQALRRIGAADGSAYELLADVYSHTEDDAAAKRCLLVFTEHVALTGVEALAKVVSDPAIPAERRAEALPVLAESHRLPEPWDGKWWGTQPARIEPPAKVLDWDGTAPVVEAVGRGLEDDSASVRSAACNAVRKMREDSLLPQLRSLLGAERDLATFDAALGTVRELVDTEAVPLLGTLLERGDLPESSRAEVVRTAGVLGGARSEEWLVRLLGDRDLGEVLTVAALDALVAIGSSERSDVVEKVLARGGPAERRAALRALTALEQDGAEPSLVQHLADPDESVRHEAITLLGPVAGDTGTAALLRGLDSADAQERELRLRALCAEARAAALPAYLAGLGDRSPVLRSLCRTAIRKIRTEVKSQVESLAAAHALPFGALPELQLLYSEPRPIVDWELVGPFDRDRFLDAIPAGDGSEEFVRDGTQRRPWKSAHAEAEHGFLDLEPWFDPNQQVCAYARATVLSWRAREAEMWVGSDDSVHVWVNGEKVHEYAGDRGWTQDQDRFRVHLRAGPNAVVLRIGQGGGQWSFNAKISPPGEGVLFEEPAAPAYSREEFRAFALGHPGDPRNGERIFFDPSGPACARCHRIGDQGELVGPELGTIGSRYAMAELVTHVLEPSQQIHDGFQTTVLFLKSGLTLEGMVVAESADALTLVDREATRHELRLADVDSRRTSQISAMPEDQVQGLTPQEFADLIAYLASRTER